MKRKVQQVLLEYGQQTLDQYKLILQQREDVSPATLGNCLCALRQFIAWCEDSWHERQEDLFFVPQAFAPSLLIRYREYLQTKCGLKPSTVNGPLMSLKHYFVWSRKTQLTQDDPPSPIKFVWKEAFSPRHLSDDEEEALVATVNAIWALRYQTIVTLLLHTGLRAQELCSLTRHQTRLGKRNKTLRFVGKHKKVHGVLLNTPMQPILNQYIETLSQNCQYLFSSEKRLRALTGRAIW